MKTFGASKEFIKDDEFEWEVVGEGIKRKIMGYDDTIMMVNVLFEKGSVGTPHEHYHSRQSTCFSCIYEGLFRLLKSYLQLFFQPSDLHLKCCFN